MDKLIKKLDFVSKILDLVIAAFVFCSIIVGILYLWKPFMEMFQSEGDVHIYVTFLGKALTLLIGVDLFKVLCKPTIHTILECVIVVMTRQMILLEYNAFDTLLTVVGIAIIASVDYFFVKEKKLSKIMVGKMDNKTDNGKDNIIDNSETKESK